MTLAPIRGAPPGAPSPDFPTDEPGVEPRKPTATPTSGDQPATFPTRQRHTPVDIRGGGITLTIKVIPELPAIARASMTIEIVADAVGRRGSLQMSDSNARTFLADLRSGRSPIVATCDEGGTVDIEFDIAEAGLVLSVRKPGQRRVLYRCVIDQNLDLKATADELLADLGA